MVYTRVRATGGMRATSGWLCQWGWWWHGVYGGRNGCLGKTKENIINTISTFFKTILSNYETRNTNPDLDQYVVEIGEMSFSGLSTNVQ